MKEVSEASQIALKKDTCGRRNVAYFGFILSAYIVVFNSMNLRPQLQFSNRNAVFVFLSVEKKKLNFIIPRRIIVHVKYYAGTQTTRK